MQGKRFMVSNPLPESEAWRDQVGFVSNDPHDKADCVMLQFMNGQRLPFNIEELSEDKIDEPLAFTAPPIEESSVIYSGPLGVSLIALTPVCWPLAALCVPKMNAN